MNSLKSTDKFREIQVFHLFVHSNKTGLVGFPDFVAKINATIIYFITVIFFHWILSVFFIAKYYFETDKQTKTIWNKLKI